MDFEEDLQTRVTALKEARVEQVAQDCFVIIHAPVHADLGKRFAVTAESIGVGRGRDNEIVLISDSVSRRHVRIDRREGGLYVRDLGSTNGTFLNDIPLRSAESRLTNGDQLKVGDFVLKHLAGTDVEARYHEIIFAMTITDGLTDISNKRQLDAVLHREIRRVERQGGDLAVLMLDIDHFKRINDTFGHLAGDAVLRTLATVLRARLRPTDELGRYGGEEFCAILPATSLANAVAIAEELRRLVEAHPFANEGRRLDVTVSIGAAVWRAGSDLKECYRAADEMLYAAKHGGRNRVCASLHTTR